MSCFSCSTATLFPDGAVRCDLDGHLAGEPCVWRSPGLSKLYKISNNQEIPKVKSRVAKTQVKPVKAAKKQKPKLQARMF